MDAVLKTEIESTVPLMAGWCEPSKALVLADLILTNHPQLIVEIGIFGGRSLMPMAQAVRHAGYNAEVWGIDPWTIEAALEGDVGAANAQWWSSIDHEGVYRGFIQKVLSFGLTKECRWLRMRGDRAARLFDDGSVNLLHLDANHSEQASCRDVMTWKDKISAAGILVLDDADWPSQQAAVRLIKDNGFEVSFDGKTYLVFRRKPLPVIAP